MGDEQVVSGERALADQQKVVGGKYVTGDEQTAVGDQQVVDGNHHHRVVEGERVTGDDELMVARCEQVVSRHEQVIGCELLSGDEHMADGDEHRWWQMRCRSVVSAWSTLSWCEINWKP